jgi:hypothetical protein
LKNLTWLFNQQVRFSSMCCSILMINDSWLLIWSTLWLIFVFIYTTISVTGSRKLNQRNK